MSEEEIGEIEKFLLPYVNERIQKWYRETRYGECIKWTARALIRCLLNVTDRIHLYEITTISLSETYYLERIKVFNNKDKHVSTFMEGSTQAFAGEIHQWITYLQENGKLPGIYERYTGFYKNK